MTTMNIGVFSEIVNKKADLDLRNVDVSKTDIVIEYQEPTEENGYKWYRLYASGWVEQGGYTLIAQSNVIETIILPIKMENSSYQVLTGYQIATEETVPYKCISAWDKTITSFKIQSSVNLKPWVVYGKADMTGHEVLPSKKEKDENDHRVVVFQKPTAENGYKWYRKYADGWIEQGGIYSQGRETKTHSLIIEMSNANYNVYIQQVGSNTQYGYGTMIKARTTTSFTVYSNEPGNSQLIWRVEGLYA